MKCSKYLGSILSLAMLTQAGLAQEMTPVNIAYVPAVHFLPAFVAKETGCFADKKLDATLTLIPIATNIPPALLAGSMQIGMSTASVLLPAVENGLNLVGIAGSSRLLAGNESISLVTQNDLTVASAKDLVGKKIGVPGILSTGDLVLRKWLKQNGVDPDEVTYIEVPFPRMMEMMSSKTVDGVVAAEPVRSILVANKVGQRSTFEYYSAVSPDSMLTFWMSTGDWPAKNPRVVASFRECLDSATQWIKDNPEKARDIEKQYLKVTTPTYPDWSTAIKASDFDLYAALGLEFGLITKDVDTSKLVYAP